MRLNTIITWLAIIATWVWFVHLIVNGGLAELTQR